LTRLEKPFIFGVEGLTGLEAICRFTIIGADGAQPGDKIIQFMEFDVAILIR
jgi:hypothetical protein